MHPYIFYANRAFAWLFIALGAYMLAYSLAYSFRLTLGLVLGALFLALGIIKSRLLRQ